MTTKSNNEHWDIVVKPQSNWMKFNFAELWAYRDLLFLLVRRDIVSIYTQTILGPLWMFLEPIFTTLVFTFTFGQAGLSTDGITPILFYLIGQTFWLYFAECFNKTSTTFITNASVFGKVYFPRLIVPLSVVISNLIKLCIQLGLLLIIYIYYLFQENNLIPQYGLLALVPICILFIGMFSLSLGVLFSSVTTKYRDFAFILKFAVQLLMFGSCVVLPLRMFIEGKSYYIFCLNPITNYMETIRFALTGHGIFSWNHILYSFGITFVCFLLAMLVFNRTEKTFMDTV
jgi:lipopolysaccharide transport system permease protein